MISHEKPKDSVLSAPEKRREKRQKGRGSELLNRKRQKERQLRKDIVIPPNISRTSKNATPVRKIPVIIKYQRKVVREIG